MSADGTFPPLSPGVLDWVRAWQSKLDIRCGGYDPPPPDTFRSSLYPFTTLTKLDFDGYPNWFDQRLESNLSHGPMGWYCGYEDGELVAARSFAPGRVLRWELELRVMCRVDADTFLEFVIEPNPRIDEYDGHDRMRCLTGALGTTWNGYRTAHARFVTTAHSERQFSTRGELVIAASGGAPEIRRQFAARVDGTHYDASEDDARWQLRWRIDALPNLERYDKTFQRNDGQNGVATEREIVVDAASFRGS
jgi:hypothetical protein